MDGLPNWTTLNLHYLAARNAVQLAVIEGRLDPDDAMLIKSELRRRLDATIDDTVNSAATWFLSVAEKYREREVHAE